MVDLLPFPSPQQLDQEPVIRIKWYVTHFKENQLVFIYSVKNLKIQRSILPNFGSINIPVFYLLLLFIIIIINNVSILTLKPGRLYFCL